MQKFGYGDSYWSKMEDLLYIHFNLFYPKKLKQKIENKSRFFLYVYYYKVNVSFFKDEDK